MPVPAPAAAAWTESEYAGSTSRSSHGPGRAEPEEPVRPQPLRVLTAGPGLLTESATVSFAGSSPGPAGGGPAALACFRLGERPRRFSWHSSCHRVDPATRKTRGAVTVTESR